MPRVGSKPHSQPERCLNSYSPKTKLIGECKGRSPIIKIGRNFVWPWGGEGWNLTHDFNKNGEKLSYAAGNNDILF
jgi:hypothetical protein